ncbi:MAG: GNAT family N-acetyltransferase [Deltaproteobacteria bacterium]|nr:GNAT family N-acetyltransferase [Deltaproteobacteria bacterium]
MADSEVKITTDPAEIREAQKLRFEVFNLEMHKGLQASYERGLDVDAFDPFCDHLIVRESKKNEIVGTYRLLRGSRVDKNLGFYSESEFDIGKIKKLDGEILELGRTCARRDFRDRALIPLMWQTIARYVEEHKVRYLFGCGSLYTTDPDEVSECFSVLKKDYYAPEALRVDPVAGYRFENVRDDQPVADAHSVFLKLPSLIKGYLRLGALVCGPPALDREFGPTDFLVLLDIQNLSDEYVSRFGMVGSKVRNAVG